MSRAELSLRSAFDECRRNVRFSQVEASFRPLRIPVITMRAQILFSYRRLQLACVVIRSS